MKSFNNANSTEELIWIKEEEKLLLFKDILNAEKQRDKDTLKYLLSAENLERICLGKTYLPDYAYSKLRSKLKKEYKQWRG